MVIQDGWALTIRTGGGREAPAAFFPPLPPGEWCWPADATVAYNPFVHPQFTANGRLLVSYNLNHVSDPKALYRDAAIYRPRFVRIDPTACPAP
jgi:hypothetical protein